MDTTRWGIVGLGRAGLARIKAMEARPHLELAGTVSSREGLGTTTLDALCADDAVDGLVICSENAHHGWMARKALDAGKHVIVEFPLAQDAVEARDLFERARRAERVLHTELIGLLTNRHRAARAVCRAGDVTDLTITFTGGVYRWVADEVAAGRLGQLAIGRLHALDDMLGPLRLEDVRCTLDETGYHLVVRFTGAGYVRVVLDERRAIGLSRSSQLSGRLADGRPLVVSPQPERGSLFGRDFDRAVARIAGEPGAAYVSDRRVVEMLALAERISAAARDVA